MRFPEFLYKLNTSDQGKQQLDITFGEADVTGTTTPLGKTVITVPPDKVLCLMNFVARTFSTGSEDVFRLQLLVSTPQGERQWEIEDLPGAVGMKQVNANWRGEIWVPPGYRVRAQGSYSAGVLSKTVEAAAHGILIPRGSFVINAFAS